MNNTIRHDKNGFAVLQRQKGKSLTAEAIKWALEEINQATKPIAIKPTHVWTDELSPCKRCTNHPSNGGSGLCSCTLGTPQVVY